MGVFFNEARSRWQYDFQRKGQRFAGYCIGVDGEPVTSRRAAEDAEARIKASLKADQKQEAEPQGYTLAEAFAHWCEVKASKNRTWDEIKGQVKELVGFFGADTPIESITLEQIERYVAWSRQQPVRRYVGGPEKGNRQFKDTGEFRSDSRTNRYLDKLRAALRFAVKHRKVRSVVFVEREHEPEAAPNPIQQGDVRRILERAPQHLYRLIVLCIHTGMRMDEATLLEWNQVDFGARTIRLGTDTKAKRGRIVHLNSVAIELLRELEAERIETSERVFLYRHKGKGKPRPFDDCHRAWYSTLEAVGLKGRYRFHDTRAAFCSLLAEHGIDPAHIKDLAGHREISTTLRYVKPSQKRLKEAVQSIEHIGRGVAVPDLKIIKRSA